MSQPKKMSITSKCNTVSIKSRISEKNILFMCFMNSWHSAYSNILRLYCYKDCKVELRVMAEFNKNHPDRRPLFQYVAELLKINIKLFSF